MINDFKLNEEELGIKPKNKPAQKGIIGLLIKYGLVKTPTQANIVMIIFIIIGMSLIVYTNLK